MRKINASEFKAKCLAILDEISNTGEGLVILKRGRPVAHVIPAVEKKEKYPQEDLLGSVKIVEGVDLTEPVVDISEWNVYK
jgi:antitoxin (DNA-binding transcriptional repressor) of toxin-antitoxin stability system